MANKGSIVGNWWDNSLYDIAGELQLNENNQYLRDQGEIFQTMEFGRELGVIRIPLEEEDEKIMLMGKEAKFFGLCNYLGLENHPLFGEMIFEAVRKFGHYFSVSTQYLRHPLYVQAEAAVQKMFCGRPVMIYKSTGMASISFFSSIIKLEETASVILDRHVHASIQVLATSSLHNVPRPIEYIKSNDTIALVNKVANLESISSKVWYCTDGVFSMTGVAIDIYAILQVQKQYPLLWIYCDDAHGTGWSGRQGRGLVIDSILEISDDETHTYHEEANRWVFAVALSKALSADGGALILPSKGMYDIITAASPFSTFSSFLSIPSLASIIAAVELCLNGTVESRQRDLQQKIRYAHEMYHHYLGRMVNIPEDIPETPILVVPVDSVMKAVNYSLNLSDRGFYVSPVGLPAARTPGLRITFTSTSKNEDIEQLFRNIQQIFEEDSFKPKL